MTGDAEIHIVPYDEGWPAQFEAERKSLDGLLQPWLVGPIEHVGSTAVPGLPAKPVIDIMAAIGDLDESRASLDLLRAAGYQYAPYRTDVMHWFCKPGFMHRTHHLHLVPYASSLWIERLAFRDYLRANSAAAAEYADLKKRLAAVHRKDREAYTEAKSEFVVRVVQAALGRER